VQKFNITYVDSTATHFAEKHLCSYEILFHASCLALRKDTDVPRTKAPDGWAANIFSSNTRCLEHRVEAARAERKTVEIWYIRVDERSAFQGEWSKKKYEVERHVKDDTSRGGIYTHPTYIWYYCHVVWRMEDTVDLFNRKWN